MRDTMRVLLLILVVLCRSYGQVGLSTPGGRYYFAHSGNLTVQASAHAATVGFFWLVNPVGATGVCYVYNFDIYSTPTAVTAFASAPRITVERVTFTGTASGATITPAQREPNDAANGCTLRTASTGMTLSAGAVVSSAVVSPVLTAVGGGVVASGTLLQGVWVFPITLRGGQGLVLRQPDAGTASDTRKVIANVRWAE